MTRCWSRHHGELHFDRAHLHAISGPVSLHVGVPGSAGRLCLGIVALVWVVDCFVGLYLTLPRAGRSWLPAWKIKRGVGWAEST